MTDAPTPVVLDKDQGSLRASPFVPTEGVTASGDLTPPPASLSKAARAGWDAFFAANGRDECPFPLARHDLRRDFEHGWDRAFASACEVENSPSPALGGYEPKANEPKDHPTPVGSLEPAAKSEDDVLLGVSDFVNEMTRDIVIGPWRISYDPPPIPTRNCDWHFVHEDYDGAPDGRPDRRAGSAATPAACIYEIIRLGEEQAEERYEQWRAFERSRKDREYELDALRAEIEGLREALNSISGLSNAGNFSISIDAARGILQRVEAIADQALGGSHD